MKEEVVPLFKMWLNDLKLAQRQIWIGSNALASNKKLPIHITANGQISIDDGHLQEETVQSVRRYILHILRINASYVATASMQFCLKRYPYIKCYDNIVL